jgi:hypothetical protein
VDPGEAADVLGVLEDRGVEPADGLALALQEVDLGLHEGGLPGDVHELVREVGDLLGARGAARGNGQPLGGGGELVGRRLAAGLVASRLGPGLLDEELDLVDLALDGLGFREETTGKLVRRRSGRGAGSPKDLSPPAS